MLAPSAFSTTPWTNPDTLPTPAPKPSPAPAPSPETVPSSPPLPSGLGPYHLVAATLVAAIAVLALQLVAR